jgi:hypothetical protein
MEPLRFTVEQCAMLQFPVGCPVWYNLSRTENDAVVEASSSFFLKRGVVQSAIWRNNKLFYEVTYADKSSTIITEEVEDGTLGFGATCPVTILPDNAAADSLEGEIVLCTPSTADSNGFVYTAMIFLDGTSKVKYEGGIEEKRVVYRKVESDNGEGREKNTGAAASEAKNDNISDSTKAAGNSSIVVSAHKGGSLNDEEDGEVIEEPRKVAAAAAARNLFVPSSITCNDDGANTLGGINVSIAATDSFESNTTITSADDSLSRKKPRYPSEYEIVAVASRKAHEHHPNVLKLEMTVPLWLQKDYQSQRDLFFHLIGANGCNTKRIIHEARCKVNVRARLKEKVTSFPITIHVEAMNISTAQEDLQIARRMIQSLLLEFVGNDGSRGRLLYEIASQSCWGPLRPNQSTSNAVKDINPFHPPQDRGEERYMSVVELPCKVTREGRPSAVHATYLLSRTMLHRIQAADATITVVAPGFKFHTKMCEPYVYLCGKSYQSVDRAVDIVKEAIRSR